MKTAADAYHNRLAELGSSDEVVTLHRKDATNVSGKVTSTTADGVTMSFSHPTNAEARTDVFVAYGDIRGIETTDWDYNVISN
ncbi:MAG: hypothetical protein KBC38_02365 [Candidatus Pacebacteria bacterium]|nr:hypothetical protein [Candidatus Paceibacterota bacterium]MBP9840631.1 hypothetical protein [Candidatus Paceibacterota bacterium]